MSNVIDAQIQQNALFYCTDIIYDKILSNSILIPQLDVTLFNDKALNTVLTPQEAGQLMINQGHIFSGFSAPTKESAKELFSDPKTDDFFIDSAYDIEHNIVVFLPVNDSDKKNVQPYYFNIDEVNRLANPDGQNGTFFISKVEIINKSKDAFTIRSNYQIILKIAFNYFEDLKDIKIKVKPLQKGLSDKEICLLQIIYPVYRMNDQLTNNSAIKNKQLESKDKFGLVLNQVLNMNDKQYFGKTIEGLDNLTKINKNYHLTYLKHEFEMFKSNYSVMVPFENELTINYIAFEAEPKPQAEEKGGIFHTSNINKNLYNLILDEQEGIAYYSALSDFNAAISNLEAAITCKNLNRPLSLLALDDNIKRLEIQNPNSKQDFINDARKLIRQLKEVILTLNKTLNLRLYQKILEIITSKNKFYKIDLLYNQLIDFESVSFWEEWTKSFADNFATFAGGGATLGTFFGPEGTLIGGLAGAAVGGTGAAIKAFTAAGTVYQQSVLELRQSIKGSSISNIAGGNQLTTTQPSLFWGTSAPLRLTGTGTGATGGFSGTPTRRSPGIPYQNPVTDEATRSVRLDIEKQKLDEAEAEVKKITEIEVQESDLTKTFELKFTLFGALLDVLTPIIGDSEIILGGKCVPVDGAFNQKFINYYYIPIAEAALIKFLKSKILDRDNSSYPIEEFIKDITENLLKNAIMIKNKPNRFFKEYVPTSVNSYAFPYIKRGPNPLENLKNAIKTDMTVAINVINARKEIVKTNYMEIGKPENIQSIGKYYTIIGSEEIKYTDFYQLFRQTLANSTANSKKFQDFIIEKYFMPCLRIKTVDAFGSILKTKNLNFKRMDNQNLQTGLMLDNSPIFRVPYEIEGEFKAYMFFFLDLAGMLFVAPPDKKDGSFNERNTFGYSGLYLVKSCKFEYTFQNANGMSITAPNNTAKVIYGGYMLTYGDAYSATQQELQTATNNLNC